MVAVTISDPYAHCYDTIGTGGLSAFSTEVQELLSQYEVYQLRSQFSSTKLINYGSSLETALCALGDWVAFCATPNLFYLNLMKFFFKNSWYIVLNTQILCE